MVSTKNGKRRAVLGAGLLALAMSFTGCVSTVATVLDPVPYAGLQVDARVAADVSKPNKTSAGDAPLLALFVVDAPLTAALDTALLPVTLPAAAAHGHAKWDFHLFH